MALIKQSSDKSMYISARKSMMICFYMHTIAKRAKGVALVDSGATENFMSLGYAKWLRLPIKMLAEPQPLFNVDGTKNKSSDLQYYMDLEVQIGTQKTYLRFFLSDLREHKAILGYPWFASMQPRIDWKRGWIDMSQLPIIFSAPNARKAQYVPHTRNVPRPIKRDQYFIGRVTFNPPMPTATPSAIPKVSQGGLQRGKRT